MAALMEGHVFSGIVNESDFLAVAELPNEDEIVVSSRKKGINILKISTQKTECSWSIRHGVTLTSPVVWDSYNERFITISNCQEVKFWDRETKDFEKAKKKQSKTKLHTALVLKEKEPILLYSNGGVGFLSNIKDHHGNGCLQDGSSIVWCAAYMLQSTVCVLCVAKSKGVVKLLRHVYSEDTSTWACLEETLPSSCQLVSCDGYMNNKEAQVYFLWSDGSLTSVGVTRDSIMVSSCHQVVPGVGVSSSLVAVDSSHLALVRVTQGGQEGICIYNTKFSMQQAWHPFPEKPNSQVKAFCVRSQLFIPCGHTLYTFAVNCEPSTLASVMAQSLHTETVSEPPMFGHVTWDKNKKDSHSEAEEGMLTLFNDIISTKHNYKAFHGMFVKLMAKLKLIEYSHWLMSSHMIKLVEQIVHETRFWAKEELKQLMEMNCIPASCLTSVMETLIKHTEVGLVSRLINSNSHLPECCLTAAIDFYLQCDDNQIQSAVKECIDRDVEFPETSQVSPQLAFLLDQVLMCSYSDVFLMESLRKMTFKNAMKLLEYLAQRMEMLAGVPAPGDGNQITQVKIVDWMCLVIDAHMTQFVLSPDCHVTLVKLHTIVSEQVEFYGCLISLEALLAKVKARTLVKQEQQVGQYCIEVLHVL